VRALRAAAAPVTLAVSGGRDSMVLMHAAAATVPDRVALVAVYDHGTGPAATAAASLVERAARALGFPVALGRAASADRTEAAWRAQRWGFLRAAARQHGAPLVATAHTEDDQLETVVMRILRGSGARGLAGLAAAGHVLRPLVAVTRADVAAYAAASGVVWCDDPSNSDLRHLRNRVRGEILPALLRARPSLGAELLALADRAAAVRGVLEAAAEAAAPEAAAFGVEVPAAALEGLTFEELAAWWPAVAARGGATLDRRGTRRLAGFTTASRPGNAMPLSGGWQVRRLADRFVLRRGTLDIPSQSVRVHPTPLDPSGQFGAFHFRRSLITGGERTGAPPGPWVADLDAEARVTVRPWLPGDRMRALAGGGARRVKRFFADARVPALDRPGWPVVLVNGTIVWIPGVRRSDAATVRPGRPGVRYECDRIIDG
jgi:tRNA(Ile)-lysidine synthase